MKIAITGHRNFTDVELMSNVLKTLKLRYMDMELICGGARGLDTFGAEWAMRYGVPFRLYYPFPYNDEVNKLLKQYAIEVKELYDKYEHNGQFQERNKAMVDVCDFLVAFWDGRKTGGTTNCIIYARRTLKPIVIVRYKGELLYANS